MHRRCMGENRADEGQVDGKRGRSGAVPGPLPAIHHQPFAGQIGEGRIAEILLEATENRLFGAPKGLADGAEVFDMQVNQACEGFFAADLMDRRVYLPVDLMFSVTRPFVGGGLQVEGF